MKKILLQRDFSFVCEKGEVDVHLTVHLFRRRDFNRGGEDGRIRAHIFKATWQIKDFIKEALESYGLWEFANCGRSVFVFENHKREKYAALLDVRLKSEKYDITIITIEQLSQRHFVEHDIFTKESIKIYSDYILPKSYMLEIDKAIERGGEADIYTTRHFAKVSNTYGFHDDVDVNRVFNSLKTRISRGKLSNGISWIYFKLTNKPPVAIKISIEPLGRKKIIILADVKRSISVVKENAKKFNINIIEIEPNSKSTGFLKSNPEIKKKNGLKIVKKLKKEK